MPQIVDWIDTALQNPDDEAFLADIRNNINDFMGNFPLFSW
jgi:glycine/serine hydroxymethyltransferase